MKLGLLEIGLIGVAAYLILGKKTSATTDTAAGSGFSGYSGSTIPQTTIPTSKEYQKVVETITRVNNITPAALVKIATQQDLGTIKVTQPARNAAGQTAWDVRIAQNFAAQGKANPYKK